MFSTVSQKSASHTILETNRGPGMAWGREWVWRVYGNLEVLGHSAVAWVTESTGGVAHGCEHWLPGSIWLLSQTFVLLQFDDLHENLSFSVVNVIVTSAIDLHLLPHRCRNCQNECS